MSSLDPERAALSQVMRELAHAGLNCGAAGNASIRTVGGMLITPTGARARSLRDEHHVEMDLDGTIAPGQLEPSSEWRFHRDIYASRPDAHAIVHVHSPCATALACMRREIPAFHYMISVGGGTSIRCARYATFGTQALSDAVLEALEARRACLLANHGLVALGEDLAAAYELTLALEDLAHQYLLTLQCGGPVLLTAGEMHDVLERFKTYGQQRDD
ncbi:MAG: class II aldolase/adducin family protein [Gammaproteobacteria bacterium]